MAMLQQQHQQVAALLARLASTSSHHQQWRAGWAAVSSATTQHLEQQHQERADSSTASSAADQQPSDVLQGSPCPLPAPPAPANRRAWKAPSLSAATPAAAAALLPPQPWHRAYHGTSPAAAAEAPAPTSTQPHSEAAAPQQQQEQEAPLSQGMRELLSVLCQPLPLGSVRNPSLNDAVVRVNDVLVIDPQRMIESTMRALYVVKQVLRLNGHVCVFNSNPAFAPLMRHASRHSTNCNMWWVTDAYVPGTLLRKPSSVMTAAAQPARARLQSKGLAMVNVHCPAPDVLDKPAPRLDTVDKWRLWSFFKGTTPSGLRGRQLLRRLVSDEVQSARLLLPGAGNQQFAPTLILVLDLSHDQQVVHDAYEAGILTSSMVNAHSELDRITYPIHAAEAHPAYTHFLLDWLLKVTNLPTPPLPAGSTVAEAAGKQQQQQQP